MPHSNLETARRVPVWLIGLLTLKLLWAVWLVSTHAVLVTSDAGCFKQPAYMRLHSPYFSIPSYAGRCPSFEKINSYPAVLYFYANHLAFRGFGFSDGVTKAVDLAIHLAFTALAAWSLWRLTGWQLPALLFALCSPQWFLPCGRPEELAMLLVLLSLLTIDRGPRGLVVAIAALGMAGATSPGAAIVGTVLVVGYDLQRPVPSGEKGRRLALLLLLPMLVAGGLYAGYAWPYLAEAFEQHRVLSRDLYATWQIHRIVVHSPRWAVSVLGPMVLALGLTGYSLKFRPVWFPSGTAGARFAIAACPTIICGLVLNIAAERLDYDYRHISVVAIAVVTLNVGWLLTFQGPRSLAAFTLAAGQLLISLPLQRDIIRYTIAPLARYTENQHVTYEDALRTVREVVPPTATVGGDGSAWTLVDDGRPYLLTRMVAEDEWPEFVISRTWHDSPSVAFNDNVGRFLNRNYVEITPQRLPQDGCSLHILGLAIPVARGRCDWHVRIWQRRQDASNGTASPHHGSPRQVAPAGE